MTTKNLRNVCGQILALIAVAILATGCSAKARKERLMRRAEGFQKAGEYDKAKIEYTNALRIDPKDSVPFEKIGVMWLEEGAPLRAGPFLLRAQELAPSRPEIKTKMAEVYIAVGGVPEARKEALDALQVDPGNESAILVLADSARTPEDIAQAEQQLKQSKHPESADYYLTVATLALRKNDMAAVEPALEKAVAADPKSSTARLAQARLKLASHDTAGATAEFKEAAELAPPRSTAHILYSEFLAQGGKTDEAIAYLQDVVKKAPDFLPAWILLAKFVAPKNYDEGIKLLENVFRRDTQNFDGRMLESEFYISKGDSKKAVDTLKQLETNYPKIPIVKYQLARAYLESGDGGTANTYLDQALALAPEYGDAILLQAEINLRNGTPAPVVPAMEDFVKKNPTIERAQVVLADAYRALGQFDKATAILQQQIAANPQKAQPYLMLGVLLQQQKKIPEARAAFEKAADLSTDKLAAVNQLIELDMAANDFPTALKRVNAQLEKTPDSAPLLLLQGRIYAAERKWDLAEATLLKVIQLNADSPSAYELLVSVYVAENKLSQAVSQLEAFIAKSPNNAGALMTLALIYNETKNYEKARDTYEKLLAVKPDVTMAMNNLAYIYSDNLNQLDKARDWAAKARNADPGNPSIADTFGWILYRQGDYKQAAGVLKGSAEKLPNQPEVQYHAGMASYMMGDSKAARSLLEAAVNSPQDFPGKDGARKRLALIADGGAKGAEFNVEQLEALVKQQPNDPVALANLAEGYANQGANEKAAELYEKAIKINPTLAGATIKLAQLYAGPLKKKDRALELAKKARELAPADARTAGILGKLAFDAGNQTWAYSLLQESARALAYDGHVLKDYAWAAYSIGKVKDGRQAMEKIVNLSGNPPESAEAKTFLLLTNPEPNAEEQTRMQTEAEEALKQDPAFVPALVVQADQQVTKGDRAAAIKTFAGILDRFPDFVPAQKELAVLYSEDPTNTSKAYELALKARKSLPDDSELALVFGRLSYQKKDYSQAIQAFQQSARKAPLDADGLYYLGMSQVSAKQVSQGLETLNRSLEAGLKDAKAEDARKVVAELSPKP